MKLPLFLLLLLVCSRASAQYSTWYPFEDEKGKTGWMTVEGSVMLKPSTIIRINYPLVHTRTHTGMIDSTGRLVLDTIYTQLYSVSNPGNSYGYDQSKDTLLAFSTGSRGSESALYGLMTKKGKQILPPEYTSISYFNENLVKCTRRRYTDPLGKDSPFKNQSCEEIQLYAVSSGTFLPFSVEDIVEFNNELFAAAFIVKPGTDCYRHKYEYVFCNRKGEVILRNEDPSSMLFNRTKKNDWQLIYSDEHGYYFYKDKLIDSFPSGLNYWKDQYGRQEIAGAFRLNDPWHYDSLRKILRDVYPYSGWFSVVSEKAHTFYDGFGEKVLSSSEYRMFDVIGGDKLAIVDANQKWGVLSKKGEVLIPAVYDSVFISWGKWLRTYSDTTPVWFDSGFKRLDTTLTFHFSNGGKRKRYEYDEERFYPYTSRKHQSMVRSLTTGKKGTINDDGTVVVPLEYDEIYQVYNGYYLVKNNKMAFADTQLRIVFPYRYEDIQLLEDPGYVRVMKKGKYGVRTIRDKKVIPVRYRFIKMYGETFLASPAKKKYGLLDKKGKTLIPLKYKNMEEVSEDHSVLLIESDSTYRYYNTLLKRYISGELPLYIKRDDYVYDIDPSDNYFGETEAGGVSFTTSEGNGILLKDGTIALIPSYQRGGGVYSQFTADARKRVLVDSTGKRLFEEEFDEVDFAGDYVAVVRKDTAYFFLDIPTLKLYPTGCTTVLRDYDNLAAKGFFLSVCNDRISLYDSTYAKVLPGDFDYKSHRDRYQYGDFGSNAIDFMKGTVIYRFDIASGTFEKPVDKSKNVLCADHSVFLADVDVIENPEGRNYMKVIKGNDVYWIAKGVKGLKGESCGLKIYHVSKKF